MNSRLIWVAAILLAASAAWAQNAASAPANESATAATEQTTVEETAPAPAGPNYSGDLWTRSALTGDWGGVRNDLAAKGITFDVGLTQFLMGNAHGGASTRNGLRYSGSTDYTLTLDTQKLGLWDGGMLLLNAETKWGDGILGKVGSLIPVNLDAVKPGYGEGCMMTLSEWIYFQRLFDGKLTLIAGKLDGSRAFDRNEFANDERTQFANAAFRNNMVIPSFLPYTDIGVGAVVAPLDWLSFTTAVADSEGRASTTGFETTFHGPTHTTLINELALKVKPFGLPGNQRVGFVWSSKEFAHLQPVSPFRQTGPLMLRLLGPQTFKKVAKYLPFDSSPDNVAFYYNFDQYLYTEAQDPTQGIGLFGRFGWARQDVNPVAHFYSIGMGGKGVLPERDKDTCGVGYYFVDLSNDMPAGYHSEQGIECYYSIEVTPWLHISPDLQIIVDPGGSNANDVSLVYGFRMQMKL